MENYRFPREIAALVIDLSGQADNGVAETSRKPESGPAGIISNHLAATMKDLAADGAIAPDDARTKAV
jgi:hypothetical protein